MNSGLWQHKLYLETVVIVLGVLFLSGLLIFFLRKKNRHLTTAWASIQSWLVAAPLIFVAIALKEPWPLIVLTLIAISGAKIFFKMTGMFHRTNFVWITYAGIIACGLLTYHDRYDVFIGLPMILLAGYCLVPLYRNSYKHMIQYIALSLMNFTFQWAFFHLGFIMKGPGGAFTLVYIIILTEVYDQLFLTVSRFLRKVPLASQINPDRSLEGFLIAGAMVMALAWGLRHLLPAQTEPYWLAAGIITILFGSLGDGVMSVIRRDLDIRETGAFILGRSDFLSRMDRLIFVAPIFYLTLSKLQELGL